MASAVTLEREYDKVRQRLAERQRALDSLIEKPHPEWATDGIPYYDEEFDLAQSPAHHKTVQKLGELLDRVAARLGLETLGDNPVWYCDPVEDRQKIQYPDYAWTDAKDLGSVTAKSLRLVIEVVTTTHRAKEHKDTVRMLRLNELHGVPEFLLVYPEPDDDRALIPYRYDAARVAYREVPLGANKRFRSRAIEGLEIEVLDKSAWKPGQKLRVYFDGEEICDAHGEQRKREAAEDRVRAEAQAREAAEQEAKRLLGLLKQAGIDPE